MDTSIADIYMVPRMFALQRFHARVHPSHLIHKFVKLLAKSLAAIFQYITGYILVQVHALLWLHSILSTIMVQSHYPICHCKWYGNGTAVVLE